MKLKSETDDGDGDKVNEISMDVDEDKIVAVEEQEETLEDKIFRNHLVGLYSYY